VAHCQQNVVQHSQDNPFARRSPFAVRPGVKSISLKLSEADAPVSGTRAEMMRDKEDERRVGEYRGGQPRSKGTRNRDRARPIERFVPAPSWLADDFSDAQHARNTRRRGAPSLVPSLSPPPLLSFAGASGLVSPAAVIIRKVRRGGSINVIVTRFRYGAGYIAIQGTIPVKAGMRCET